MIKPGEKYALLTFDTESDMGSWTQEYTSIEKALPLIDDVLQSRKIRSTFFWEGVAALLAPHMVKRLFDAGHEIGAHSYKHETLGDVTYSIPGDRAILPEEVPNRIRRNTEILTKITGENPVSFRAPRLWGSGELNRILESLGFLIDSSYPISSETCNLFPYHSDYNNWAVEGDSKILEMPLAAIFGEMLDVVSEELRAFGEEFKIDPESHCINQWPILRLFGENALISFLEPFIELQMAQRGCSIVNIYLHPWEFIPMRGVLTGIEARIELSRTLHENCGEKTLAAMDTFIGIMQDKGFKFVTTSELYRIWES